MNNLQENLRKSRIEKGFSLGEMAQAIGVSSSMLCQVEKGVRLPSIAMIFNMAEVLNCSLDELTGFNLRKED